MYIVTCNWIRAFSPKQVRRADLKSTTHSKIALVWGHVSNINNIRRVVVQIVEFADIADLQKSVITSEITLTGFEKLEGMDKSRIKIPRGW